MTPTDEIYAKCWSLRSHKPAVTSAAGGGGDVYSLTLLPRRQTAIEKCCHERLKTNELQPRRVTFTSD